jgi:hypothetical protein
LEVEAIDAAGKSIPWRTANFTVEADQALNAREYHVYRFFAAARLAHPSG